MMAGILYFLFPNFFLWRSLYTNDLVMGCRLFQMHNNFNSIIIICTKNLVVKI